MTSTTKLAVWMFAATWLSAASVRAADEAKAVMPFNGKNLDGWTFKNKDKSHWVVGVAKMAADNNKALTVSESPAGKGELVNATGGGTDIYTTDKWGDATIELEFMTPQGSNSGVYVMGEYEVQILDSYGKKQVGPGDVGGLYGAAAPKTNAADKPGEWQKFVIEFEAPKFKDGKKVSNAKFVKVTLNDQVIHENVEMKGPTPSGVTGKEAETGPLMFQGDHGPVGIRNIKIMPK